MGDIACLSHVQGASLSSLSSLAAKTAKASEGEGGDDIHAGHDAELEFRTQIALPRGSAI